MRSPRVPLCDPNLRSDELLCARVRSGSTEAFSELWQRHQAEALGYARKLNPTLAEDAVSDVMVSVYEALCAGKGPQSSFRSYVLLSIRNRLYRLGKGTSGAELPDDDQLQAPELKSDVERDEDAAAVHLALDQLPARWQQVLILTEVHGKSLADVGNELGIGSNAVSALLRRARAGLRQSWVAAHFAGAKLGDECSNVVEAFGDFRWGKPPERQRVWFDRHLRECESCSERHGAHAWLAQAVGLSLMPIVGGGAALIPQRVAVKTWAASQPVAATLSTGLVSAAVIAAAITTFGMHAPHHVDEQSPTVLNKNEPKTASEIAVVDAHVAPDSSESSNDGTGGEALPPATTVHDAPPTVQEESAEPTQLLPEGDHATAVEPQPVANSWVERISGGTQPGVKIDFELSDGAVLSTTADSEGRFALDVSWSEAKPAFGYTVR